MDRLGLTIYWLPILVGETKGPVPIRTGVVVPGGISTVFLSRGIVLPVSFQFTTRGSLKTRAALRAASVTIYIERTVCTACKVPPLSATPTTFVCLARGMTTRMISRMSRLINNFCGEFSSVVPVSATFLSFPSLV